MSSRNLYLTRVGIPCIFYVNSIRHDYPFVPKPEHIFGTFLGRIL